MHRRRTDRFFLLADWVVRVKIDAREERERAKLAGDEDTAYFFEGAGAASLVCRVKEVSRVKTLAGEADVFKVEYWPGLEPPTDPMIVTLRAPLGYEMLTREGDAGPYASETESVYNFE
jgi:hypothetical protein